MKVKKIMIYYVVMLTTLYSTLIIQAQCDSPSGCLSGVVFEDYNCNGLRNIEPGIQGVQIEIYDETNNIVGTVFSGNLGDWELCGLMDDFQYRVEFIIPTSIDIWANPTHAGIDNSTDVQFVTVPACANFSISSPSSFCQEDPQVVTTCYVVSSIEDNPQELTIISTFESQATNTGSENDAWVTDHNISVPFGEVGSVWGLAYNEQCNSLFASANIKTQTEVAPIGIGGIYIIDNSTNTDMIGDVNTVTTADLWIDLEDPTIGIDLGDNPYDTEPFSTAFNREVYAGVGKNGIGDVDIHGDNSALYATNLFNRTLLVLPIGPNCEAPTASEIIEVSIPDPSSCNDITRPWAVKYHKGMVYVGMVCTGELTNEGVDDKANLDRSDLNAYVYAFDPISNTFGTNPVLEFSLAYERTWTDNTLPAAWQPWVDRFVWDLFYTYEKSANNYRGSLAQPILSDIEFIDCDMVLGFTDRQASQFGRGPPPQDELSDGTFSNGYPNGTNELLIIPGGDLLIAGYNGGNTWTIENNGVVTSVCGDLTSNNNDPQNQRSSLPSPYNSHTGSGPGGSEFFWGDYYSSSHNEVTLGGLVVHPGTEEVISTTYDPLQHVNGAFSIGGLTWYSSEDGSYSKAQKLYEGSSLNFRKGAGFGDVELLCDPAPLEIGNYVWCDSIPNGIQDAFEVGLNGITVQLYDSLGTLIGVTSTSNGGQYFFNQENTDTTGVDGSGTANSGTFTGMNFDTPYFIVFGESQFIGNKFVLGGEEYGITTANINGNTNDNIDSDVNGNALTVGLVGIPNDLPYISMRTDEQGCANHTFDLGLICSPIYDAALSKTVNTNIASIGDTVIFTLMVKNEGTEELTGIEVNDIFPSGLTYINDDSGGDYDNGTGIWNVGNLIVGDSILINIEAIVVSDGVFTNEAEIVATNEQDIDSTPNNSDPYEDDIESACISVPIEVCANEMISINLLAESGFSNYQWYKDGVLIDGENSAIYVATEIGTYTYTVDGGGPIGDCQGELCCPIVIITVECCQSIQCIPVTITINN